MIEMDDTLFDFFFFIVNQTFLKLKSLFNNCTYILYNL